MTGKARALLLVAAALGVPFLVMASDVHSKIAVPVGIASCLIASFGLLDVLGTFDWGAEPDTPLDGALLPKRALGLLAWLLTLLGSLWLAVAGVLPAPRASAAVLVTTSFLGSVVAAYRLARALGAYSDPEAGTPERQLGERHGFWFVVLTTLLYLPLLGSYSLSDPWEVHYGEVAREMLARDDWLSLWWAQDGWFWSKPVMTFWMLGLSFSLFGVRYQPDAMLEGVAAGRAPSPEWAARFPVFIMVVLAGYVLYKAVATSHGRRAGFLGAMVLVTLPYWFLLSHQTMTDMPYVAPLTMCMGFFLLGQSSDPEARCRTRAVRIGSRVLHVSAYHLLYAAILLCVLPQILYLLSRNVTLYVSSPPYVFRFHLDEFFAGSGGGNCGLPGNQVCSERAAASAAWQPALLALVWTALLALLLILGRRERRVRQLYFLAAWLSLALAAMAKGAPGLLIPVFTILVFVVGSGRVRELRHMELGSLVLLVACIVLPWYVQMLARHGPGFIDRLLFHDMWKRAFVHVHDTNDGADTSFRYYVWQLGYGLFPWTGLGAAGLLLWLRRDDAEPAAGVHAPRNDVPAFLGLWFITAFGLFTLSLTKFHHYILPAVPAIAMLVGILLDQKLPEVRASSARRRVAYFTGLGAGALLALYGTLRFFPGAVGGWLVSPEAGLDRAPWRGTAAILSAAALFVLGVRSLRVRTEAFPSGSVRDPDTLARGSKLPSFELSALASAAIAALVGRDFFSVEAGNQLGQLRLLHLITYNYRRPWPKTLDFGGVLLAFTIVATIACLLLAVRSIRVHAAVFLGCVALWWTAFGVNVYLVRTAPHWGQRETIAAYYRARAGPEEPLVAYQMNWKGENFYTGNRLPAFVSSQRPFQKWVTERKDQGTRVMFFSTEPGRINGLKRELGKYKSFELVTDETLNNKFVIARVEL